MKTSRIVKKLSELLMAMVMVVGFTAMAQADLTVVGTGTFNGGTGENTVNGGYQLIYDSAQNITWLDYSYCHVWQNSVNWAQNLVVNFNGQNVSGWSLPSTVDGPLNWSYNGTTSEGYNNTSSEMGYLYYTELGNKGYYDKNGNPQSGYGFANTAPFKNLYGNAFWSGTEYSADPLSAWVFGTVYGNQGVTSKSYAYYALAVLPGDVAATPTPIPAAALLLGSGLSGLIGMMRRRG